MMSTTTSTIDMNFNHNQSLIKNIIIKLMSHDDSIIKYNIFYINKNEFELQVLHTKYLEKNLKNLKFEYWDTNNSSKVFPYRCCLI